MCASVSTWKPLQYPHDRPAGGGERAHGAHHRREAGDRAGAQVVAVGKAAWQYDRVQPVQGCSPMPDELSFGTEAIERFDNVVLAIGAREHDYARLAAPP